MASRILWHVSIVTLLLAVTGCSGQEHSSPPPTLTTLADEITIYTWAEYFPQSILDAFFAEYGVRVKTIDYPTVEEADEQIQAGAEYDLVVMHPEVIGPWVNSGLLAEIDFDNVPNFRNVSANFRDLTFDPNSRHSIPYHWGTTGILVRDDLVESLPTRWSDLWDPQYAGRLAMWPFPRDMTAIALSALGYDANSEDPAELEAALQHIVKLGPDVMWLNGLSASIIPTLVSGEAIAGWGWAYDALLAREASVPISYIMPEEGTLLWSDYFVIPMTSQNKSTAEVFLNFILRPDISAQIVNESFYPMANDAAEPFINPEILSDTVIFPDEEQLRNAQLIMGIRPEANRLILDLWDRYVGVVGEDPNDEP